MSDTDIFLAAVRAHTRVLKLPTIGRECDALARQSPGEQHHDTDPGNEIGDEQQRYQWRRQQPLRRAGMTDEKPTCDKNTDRSDDGADLDQRHDRAAPIGDSQAPPPAWQSEPGYGFVTRLMCRHRGYATTERCRDNTNEEVSVSVAARFSRFVARSWDRCRDR